MKGFFVTGTDTNVGKTLVACGLANIYQDIITVRKPVESGCKLINGELFPEDAYQLKQASKSNEPLSSICPYVFAEPINPDTAAINNQQIITLDDLVKVCQSHKPIIVEGAGGWLSPIAQNTTNADFAEQLQLPIILVVANRLGCINHTLLTLESIKSRNLDIHAIYLNQNTISNNEYNNFKDLVRWTNLSVKIIPFIRLKPIWQGFKID